MMTSQQRPARRSAGSAMRAVLAMVLALVVGATGPAVMATGAQAAGGSLQTHADGTYVWFDGGYYGVIAQMPDGRQAYCMELGKLHNLTYERTEPVADSQEVRQLAWLMQQYEGNRDALTHAAIASLIHEKIDMRKDLWPERLQKVTARNPDMPAKMEELRAQMVRHAPQRIEVQTEYTDGLRAGRVGVRVLNAEGGAAPGTPFTLTLEGPATFTDGSGTSRNEKSGDGISWFTWTASGRAGQVRASATYEYGTLIRLDSAQDLVVISDKGTGKGEDNVFPVRRDFTPAVTTAVTQKTVDPGQPVEDRVTSAVADKDHDYWVKGLKLTADGYYFTGIQPDEVGSSINPGADDTVEDFLAGLKERGFKPVAYGTASFTGPGQSVTVRAVTSPNGKQEYRARSGDDVGTWVWAFNASEQSQQAREVVLDDAISPFLELAETSSTRRELAVESSVAEPAVQAGDEISDTITVRGFPDDHGKFTGSTALGLEADEPLAQVTVWWAGDADNPANDDAYKPEGADVPTEDEHHRKVGTWEYAATNGTFRVGGGEPDAHGNPVHLVAEDHGWYVFVWSFAGDSRVMPAASRYDDEHERTRVTLEVPPETPPEAPPQEEPPLPETGSAVAGVFLAAVSALAVGLVTLAVVKRRSLNVSGNHSRKP